MPEQETPRQLRAILDVLGLELNSLHGQNAGPNRQAVMAWLYRILDTLDTKTGHLLRFSALLLAAQTFLANLFLVRGGPTTAPVHYPPWMPIVVLLLLLLPLGAALFTLRVLEVRWPFFGYVRKRKNKGNIPELIFGSVPESKEGGPSTIDERIDEEMLELAKVCDKRYDANRNAYVLCWASAGAFLVTLGLTIIFR